ncbi:MAG TPA: UDP binding domain-containing protein, partial [Jiangellaceae bacterium]
LGVAYKPDVADQRESPAAPLARHLANLGARVLYHDPHVAQWNVPGVAVNRVADLQTAVTEADLVILVQNHRSYDAQALASRSQHFFDTRGVTTGEVSQRL